MSDQTPRSAQNWLDVAARAKAEDPELSPCVGVCVMDEASGFCAGCLRTLDEIACWSSADNTRKRAIKAALPARRAQSRKAAS